MLRETITKFWALVILHAVLWLLLCSCSAWLGRHGQPPLIDRSRPRYSDPSSRGNLESPEILESSGLASSKCRDEILWTHNDSGDGPFIFAIDTNGRHLGVWRVRNAENLDWEDIASVRSSNGKCFIYIAEIGNSAAEKRDRQRIYRIPEPDVVPDGANSTRSAPLETAAAEVLEFKYPDGSRDAETLLVHPLTGRIYVVTRHRTEPARVYALENIFGGQLQTAQFVSEIKVPAIPFGFLSAGDIASDGTRLVLSDYFAAYEMVLPERAVDFDEIWSTQPIPIDPGKRKQGEGIAYSRDGRLIYSTSEGVHQPLNEIKRIE